MARSVSGEMLTPSQRMKASVFSRPQGAKVSTMRLGCVPAPRQSRR
jgi:hypothetical protein